jgi:O-antigen/teichoic acid export membrane protein
MSVRRRIRHWARLFSEYAAAQVVIQALGVLAGLWLVNLLPVREYALYTFALSILAFLSVFSDLGVGSALIYFRRETRAAGAAFEPYVRAAYRVRYALLVPGLCAGLVFLAKMGPERGFAGAEILAVAAMLAAAVWAQVGSSIAVLQLRLEGLYRGSYVAEGCANAMRLLVVTAMWLGAAPLAWLAMLSGAAGALTGRAVAAGALRRAGQAPPPRPAREPGHAPLKGIVRYVLPISLSAAYFSIQGPLVIWLSAYFAGTRSVAEVGALGRLGLIFGLLSGFMGAVLIPRLSAVTDEALYLRRYLQFWVVLGGFGAGVVALAWAVPDGLLWLLGEAYAGLGAAVLVVAVSAVLASWGGYIVAINNARGWVRLQPVAVAIFAAVQISLIMVLDLSSTIGVLYYGLWSGLAGLVLQIAINAAGFLKLACVGNGAVGVGGGEEPGARADR